MACPAAAQRLVLSSRKAAGKSWIAGSRGRLVAAIAGIASAACPVRASFLV